MTARVVRVGASILALAAVAIGVPLVAVAVARARFGSANPLAEVEPPWRWRPQVLTERLTDETTVDVIIRTGLVVLWVAAAVVVVTTVVETVHLVRHRGLPLPQVRGIGWAQPIARFIAGGVLVLVPLSSTGASLARAPDLVAREVIDDSHAIAADETSTAPAGQVESPRPSTVEHVVRSGDSVYSIASVHAGDPDAVLDVADSIIEANLGREMPDGRRFTNPALIEPGWILEIPGGTDASLRSAEAPAVAAESVHVVAPGDTLWGIASARLGDPLAWPEIHELNDGRTMSDGRVFDDPDLILPGWVLDLPTPQPVTDADHATEIDHDTDGDPVSPQVPRSGEQGTSPPPPTPPDTASPPAPPDRTSPPASTTAAATPAPPAPSTPAPTVTSTTTDPPVVGDAGDGAGADDVGDDQAPLRLEHAALLAAGVLALVGVARRRRLRTSAPRHRVPAPPPGVRDTERRLRSIDDGARSQRVDVACRAIAAEILDSGHRIGSITVGDTGDLEVRLTGEAVLPEPWSGGGARWRLGAEVPIELLAAAARRVDMPCVALVQLGLTPDGAQVLVDLEACGHLRIDAPEEVADQVVAAIAAGLASSVHAEVAHLVTARLGSEPLLGHRNAHQVDSATAALELAAELVGTTGQAGATTFELRSRRTSGEMWEPVVVLLAHADEVPGAVVAGTGVAVVSAGGPVDSGATLARTAEGWRLLAFDDGIALRPVALDRGELTAVVDLVDHARSELAAADELRWADDEQDPAVASANEFTERDHAVVVGLLGGVTIEDTDGRAGTFERSKTVELIAWLATHRDRSTRSGARTALWELDVRDATFANVVSEARRGLARLVAPPDGEEWVGRTLSDALPLHDLVVTDAELVADRLDHARLEPPAQAIDTLRPAVAMIRDVPFAGTSYLWPDAEGITSNLVLLAIGAAIEYSAHALSLGDIDGVFWATGQGLKVLPGHEELVGLRMQAHARAGDLAGVRHEWATYERVLTADPWSDGEPAPKLVELRRRLLDTASNS